MTLNCKSGDMAVVGNKALPINKDKIVEIGAFLGEDPVWNGFRWNVGEGPRWIVTCKAGIFDSDGVGHFAAPVADRNLRPISGVPIDEDVTEDLREPA
jgi:hypothetical protein